MEEDRTQGQVSGWKQLEQYVCAPYSTLLKEASYVDPVADAR
jgi:hypothetical protein